ncbi:hypothetical protein ACF07T_39990 [Streptomyces sp. NPDC015184]|uniref:hypothetical protein n=1 Tax=Streptomyces sp. NPDC015184 TaxID=3364946 RepID=UPI0036F54517
MTLPPFRPEDFDEECETCHVAPGQLCRPWCDTGYTADDHRADAARQADRPGTQPPHRRLTTAQETP